jgi:23S rRNA (cytidine1920-2'-O)/16S rRNA (cytidine1409-2'-O)-methyltransferase
VTDGRLDVALVRRGLARSRKAALELIAAGLVRVDGRVASRPSTPVGPGTALEVEQGPRWVGRAAGKLDAALDAFGIDVAGLSALDVGASTGGFTQVLLERGARTVVALDVGHGQLVPELRADPRVITVEGENARYLTADRLAELTGSRELPGVVVGDLSFISLTLVLPAIASVLAADADAVLLIKPQFEVGRTGVRDGIVADPAARAAAVRAVLAAASTAGLRTVGLLRSPVVGTHGNVEVLAHVQQRRGGDPAEWHGSGEWDERIEQVVRDDDGGTA